jgi:hypothetical protein
MAGKSNITHHKDVRIGRRRQGGRRKGEGQGPGKKAKK